MSNRWETGSGPSALFERAKEKGGVLSESNGQTTEPVSLAWKELLRDEILDIASACSREGWDGEEAVPISSASVGRAIRLIYLAPDVVRPPEAVPSVDGEIAFEWRFGKYRRLSLLVHGDEIVFSAILGALNNRESASKPFVDGWPTRLTEILTKQCTSA
ncbi:MAG: hypothetical protein EWM73_00058 [Nitrospira sp.]|nr:MAG: hypothetical protein EWM73_00058 [Nitrospira sp.]